MNKRIIAPIALLVTFMAPALAHAEAAAGAAGTGHFSAVAFGMAFAIGLAALGGGIGQGRAVAAALEGICRNPNSADKVFVPMLLGLAFIESLVIFALVISFQLGGLLG